MPSPAKVCQQTKKWLGSSVNPVSTPKLGKFLFNTSKTGKVKEPRIAVIANPTLKLFMFKYILLTKYISVAAIEELNRIEYLPKIGSIPINEIIAIMKTGKVSDNPSKVA